MATEAALDRVAGGARPLGLRGVGSQGVTEADPWEARHSSFPEMPLLEPFPFFFFF